MGHLEGSSALPPASAPALAVVGSGTAAGESAQAQVSLAEAHPGGGGDGLESASQASPLWGDSFIGVCRVQTTYLDHPFPSQGPSHS